MTLVLRGRELTARPGRPLIMGVVNAGPDSFSDSVRHTTLAQQVEHALALVAEGADVVDVGAESGVTHSSPSPPEVEVERVVPLVRELVQAGITVSVDTFKAPVAAGALEAGAHLINDVSGLRDPTLARLVAGAGAGLVVMHTRAPPKQRSFADYGGDVAGDVRRFLRERCDQALDLGVAPGALLADPGPDFAKRPHESVELLRHPGAWCPAGVPWLAAVSRKYLLGAITGRPPDQRLGATLAAVAWAAHAGAAMVRVHDVREVHDLLAVLAVLEGNAAMPEVDADDERLMWLRPAETGPSAP